MNGTDRNVRYLMCLGGVMLGVGVGACGGGDSSSASVGECIDAANNVVDCSSASATKKLVSDQSESDAIACIAIGDKPQVQVKVGDGTFCAEDK